MKLFTTAAERRIDNIISDAVSTFDTDRENVTISADTKQVTVNGTTYNVSAKGRARWLGHSGYTFEVAVVETVEATELTTPSAKSYEIIDAAEQFIVTFNGVEIGRDFTRIGACILIAEHRAAEPAPMTPAQAYRAKCLAAIAAYRERPPEATTAAAGIVMFTRRQARMLNKAAAL